MKRIAVVSVLMMWLNVCLYNGWLWWFALSLYIGILLFLAAFIGQQNQGYPDNE